MVSLNKAKIIQYFIYLRAYSTVKRPIIKLAQAETQTKQTYIQTKTKPNNQHHLDNSKEISVIAPAVVQ
jgi:hypothetical protein